MKTYVVLFDDVRIITDKDRFDDFDDVMRYGTFREAKNALVSYHENRLQDAKINIKEARLIKLKDVK